ncbi:putative quinol monooxygenase [Aquisphaera insulae]|uniref:putative quinol monooxygenase n=1 Tax=Aquisphaera insulae TaxID=2712864 RepID=UPI0013EAD760|nr:antibiotic biosynthesis monooxygenase [Aquisphaera insulae]
MLIVHVQIEVKPEHVDAFKVASADNSRNSLMEPGIARFDVLQQQDDPTKFVLVEIYTTEDAPAAHKQTDHYKRWAATVAPMMAAPRTGLKYSKLFPQDGTP